MHSSCILARKQVIKLMLKYELIKIFSKRINRVVLVAALVVTIIYSGLAIGSMSYIRMKRGRVTRELKQDAFWLKI